MERWYAVQVATGSERAAAADIRRYAGRDVVRECFSPLWQTQEKRHGRYELVERKLMPGYVMAKTADPEGLRDRLGMLPRIAKAVQAGDALVPMADEEADWIERHVRGERRVIPMTHAVKKDGVVTMTDGPLTDETLRVVHIDRHRSTAYIEMTFTGEAKRVPLGIAVLPAVEGAQPEGARIIRSAAAERTAAVVGA